MKRQSTITHNKAARILRDNDIVWKDFFDLIAIRERRTESEVVLQAVQYMIDYIQGRV